MKKEVLKKLNIKDNSLNWIEKDKIAGKCLNKFLKNQPDTSPLYEISLI